MNNSTRHFIRIVLSAAAIAFAWAITSGEALGYQSPTRSQSRSVYTTVNDDDKNVIEIRVEGGDISVKRNGVAVPDAQVRREGGRIVILNEKGETIDEANIWMAQDGGASVYEFEEGHPMAEAMAMYRVAAAKDAPKVMVGVQTTKPGPALEKHLRLEPGKTIMISALYEGLPAAEAGLEQFDIVIEVDGQGFEEDKGLVQFLTDKKAGDKLRLRVIHEGQPKELVLELDEYDAKKMRSAKVIGGSPSWTAFAEGFAGPNVELKMEPLEGFVYSPEHNELFKRLEELPQDGRFWRGAIEALPRIESNRAELDARLERLDERMAKLEQMLDKLIQQNQRTR